MNETLAATTATISHPLWQWVAFHVVIVILLALDLGVGQRKAHSPKFLESIGWVGFYLLCTAAFAFWIYTEYGLDSAVLFATGYLVEYTLSVDNLFVFVMIFGFFAVPEKIRHRVLFWGILGALIFRGIFIALGTVLIAQFSWILDVFGAFLIYTAIKLLVAEDKEIDPKKNPIVNLIRRWIPVSQAYDGAKFITRIDGKRFITPLMIVLISLETTDVIFAVDSIPAIFSITSDPFLVYTSNIFAILGLRSLFFVLDRLLPLFRFLKPAISLVLGFIGLKMVAHHWYVISPLLSLSIVLTILGGAVILSLIWKQEKNVKPEN